MRAALLALLALFGGISCDKPPPVELPPPKVGVTEVLSAEIADELTFPGRTVAPQRVTVGAQVAGTVAERFFDDGDAVKRGQKLFQVDARSPEAALAQARADLARAKVNAAEAERTAKTNKELLDRGVIGREEYRQSVTASGAAKALVSANEAIVSSAKLTKGFATVVAPFDGRIGQADVDVGAIVGPGTPMAVLARLDPIYVDFSLSEREYLRLVGTLRDAGEQGAKDAKRGIDVINDRVIVALQLADGSVHDYQGMLSIVSVEIDEATGSYPLRAVFPNPDRTLIPGLYGHVIVRPTKTHLSVLVPQQALVLKQIGVVAYVIDADGTLSQKRVELGPALGDLVPVSRGLVAGDRIVSEGVHKCRDGLSVTAVPQESLSLESDPLAQTPKKGSKGWFERFMAEKRVATMVGG